MAGVTTFDTYIAKGIREDLTDIIADISPTDTPFVSNVGAGSSKGTYHEWQQDSLSDPTDSPVAEGADAAPVALTPTVRLGNYTQINDKSFIISGSDMVADNAGRGVEMAYQEAKKGLELRKDVEFRCVGGSGPAVAGYAQGTGNAGGSPTARRAANLLAWTYGNTVFNDGDGGLDPTVNNGSVGRTDATATVAFTEGMLTDVIDLMYLAGANPTMIMANTTQKRVITTSFRGSTDENKNDTDSKRVIAAVDFYESDYGTLSVVPNRYMRQRDLFILDPSFWSVDNYRPYMTQDLAKTGDNMKKQMLVEWTLTAKQALSGGGIFDLS